MGSVLGATVPLLHSSLDKTDDNTHHFTTRPCDKELERGARATNPQNALAQLPIPESVWGKWGPENTAPFHPEVFAVAGTRDRRLLIAGASALGHDVALFRRIRPF